MISAKVHEGRTVKVGDSVEFKCDIEQCGEIVAIRRESFGRVELVLKGHFIGEYIGGTTKTTMDAEDCW